MDEQHWTDRVRQHWLMGERRRGASPFRALRYRVEVRFCGGAKPLRLADFETRKEAREYAGCWALDTLFERAVPEAAVSVAVIYNRDERLVTEFDLTLNPFPADTPPSADLPAS